MREIRCSQCGKLLFKTDKSDGAAGNEARKLGFIFKMPFLYGIPGCFFFCNKECYAKWSDANISPEAKEKGNKLISEIKAEQPKIVSELSDGINRIKSLFNHI